MGMETVLLINAAHHNKVHTILGLDLMHGSEVCRVLCCVFIYGKDRKTQGDITFPNGKSTAPRKDD